MTKLVLKNVTKYVTSARMRERVVGWSGGDQYGPSTFFIWWHINEQDALILNMVAKIARAH